MIYSRWAPRDFTQQMKFWHYALASTLTVTGLVAVKAAQSPNYFVSAHALTLSLLSILVVCNFVAMLAMLVGKTVISVFLGKLRDAEWEALTSSLGMFVIELMITTSSMTQIQYTPSLITCGFPVVFLMVLHLLARERVKILFRGIELPSRFTQVRFASYLVFLAAADFAILSYAYQQFLDGHFTMLFYSLRIFWILELLTYSISTFVIDKYDAYYLEVNDEDHWENKALYVFCTEVFSKLMTFVGICGLVYLFSGAVSPLYVSFLVQLYDIVSLVRKFLAARRVQSDLDKYVTEASTADLERDNTCVVCRDEMETNVSSVRLAPKRLGCGHVIHKGCLVLWMGRSQDCPTCRQPVKSQPKNFHSFTSASSQAHGPPGSATIPETRIPAPTAAGTAGPAQQPDTDDREREEFFRDPSDSASSANPQATANPTGPVLVDLREWTSFEVQIEGNARKVKIGDSWHALIEE